MIDWTQEAIEAALDAAYKGGGMIETTAMRDALDAAAKAQGVDDAFDAGVRSTFKQRAEDLECIHREGWNEAIEAAAKHLDTHWDGERGDDIRALAKAADENKRSNPPVSAHVSL